MLSGKSAWQFDKADFRSGSAPRMSAAPVRAGIIGPTTTPCRSTVSGIREGTRSISGGTGTAPTAFWIDATEAASGSSPQCIYPPADNRSAQVGCHLHHASGLAPDPCPARIRSRGFPRALPDESGHGQQHSGAVDQQTGQGKTREGDTSLHHLHEEDDERPECRDRAQQQHADAGQGLLHRIERKRHDRQSDEDCDGGIPGLHRCLVIQSEQPAERGQDDVERKSECEYRYGTNAPGIEGPAVDEHPCKCASREQRTSRAQEPRDQRTANETGEPQERRADEKDDPGGDQDEADPLLPRIQGHRLPDSQECQSDRGDRHGRGRQREGNRRLDELDGEQIEDPSRRGGTVACEQPSEVPPAQPDLFGIELPDPQKQEKRRDPEHPESQLE